jgi:hypothetical protein
MMIPIAQPPFVIPAKAGTHCYVSADPTVKVNLREEWVPAFAGMTVFGEQRNAA